MAFTGVLGSSDGNFGNFALGRVIPSVPPDLFDPEVIADLVMTQTLTVEKDSNVTVEQTLTITQVAEKMPGYPAIVGYTGGQTRYAYSYDVDGHQGLHRLNEDVVFPYPASCTKLMTALLIMEYHGSNLAATVTVTSADLSIFGGASTAGLQNGDILTWEELLYAIITPSGGDACQCAARIIGTEIYVAAGSTGNTGMTRFHERMNARAAELGMTNTFYYDSWGESTISGNVRNSTTAKDLAMLLAECIEHPDLNTVMGAPTYVMNFPSPNIRTANWSNVNRMVNGPTQTQAGIKGDNVIGGKVGEWNGDGVHVNLANAWTAPNGNRIVTVVMNAPDYQSLSWDHLGLMYAAIIDWPYLMDGVTEPLDSDFSKVKVLATANGSIVDESSFGRTATPSGATADTAFLYGSTGSINMTNTGHVSFPDAADLVIGSDDATIELWYKPPNDHNPSNEQLFFLKATTNNLEFALNWYPTAIQTFASSNGTGYSSTIITANTSVLTRTFFNGAPRHLAWVKEGSTISCYLNGERFDAELTVASIFDGTATFRIGGDNSVGATSAVGRISDLRFTTDLARYTVEKHTLTPRAFPRSSVAATPSSNALSLTQSATLTKDVVRELDHTLSMTQAAYRVIDETADSTLVLDHDLTFEKFKAASGSNILVPSQTVEVEVSFERTVNQGLPFTHTAGRNIYRVLSASNTLGASQLAVGVVTRPTSNVLTLTDLAEALVGKVAQNVLSVGQTVDKAVTYNRNAADNYIPFQTISRQLTIRRSLSDTLSMSQTLVAFVVKSASNVLVPSQSVSVDKTKPASDQLDIFQIAQVFRSFTMPVDQPLPLSQELFVAKGKSVSVLHAFGMNQFARGTRRLTVTAANALALAHALVQEYKDRSIEQMLDLDDELIVSKLAPRSAENALVLTQTVQVAKTLVRTIVDTITFHNSFEKYVGIGGHETVTVPAVQVVKVKKLVTLQSDSLVIVLPAPEFNDSEGGTGRINIKRTMAGGRRVYARDNVTSKLNYQFIIDRKKAIELRNFIMNSNTKFLRMENWKGEIWAVQMTNSPFSFGEDAAWLGSPGGNKSSITLEFEGVRLN